MAGRITEDDFKEYLEQHFALISDSQDELKKSIEKVNNALLDPENGIYTRVRTLESAKNFWTKIFWIITTSASGLFFAAYVMPKLLGK